MAKASKNSRPLPLPGKEEKATTTIRVSTETTRIFYKIRHAMMSEAMVRNIPVSEEFGGIYSTNQVLAAVLRDFAERYNIDISGPSTTEVSES